MEVRTCAFLAGAEVQFSVRTKAFLRFDMFGTLNFMSTEVSISLAVTC